jgi:hypothetical protein
MGAAVQRAIHAGHAPIAATPVGPVSVVAQREQAPAGRSRAVPESGPLATAADPVAILSASTDRVLVDADDAAVDGDWPSLPGSGSSVGPVGSRPLQRSLAEAPAPAGRATDPSRLGIDLAGSGPVPRSGSAFSDTGSRHVDMSLPVSRLAAASSPASQVPGLPPTVRGAFAHAAAPLTLQTLSSADDAPPPAVPAPSTVVVERVASPADEAGEADGVPFAGFPPVTVARAVVQPLEEATGAPPAGGGAAAGGPAAVAAIAPGDVDALVRKLYDPLARRLRAELRLDRERIGRSLDLRH